MKDLCAVVGCLNRRTSSTKHFFWSPRNKELRDQWMEAIGRKFKVESGFVVCEDHFDMTNDVTIRPSDSRPVLKTSVIPHLNIEQLGEDVSTGKLCRIVNLLLIRILVFVSFLFMVKHRKTTSCFCDYVSCDVESGRNW